MWAYRMAGPAKVERIEVPSDESALGARQVRLRFRAGGLCGSDMPRFNGGLQAEGDPPVGSAPLHELVAEVLDGAGSDLRAGERVVGMLGAERGGLAEVVVGAADHFIPVPDELGDAEAVIVQSLGTVVRASTQFVDLTGSRVAVLGSGPCGLMFCHLLKHHLGASHVTVVDPVDHEAAAREQGADAFCQMASGPWSRLVAEEDRPQAVIEAVGHQQRTIADAVRAVAPGGYVFGFGAPDDSDYVFPYLQVYDKDLTVASGKTRGGWRAVLRNGLDELLAHRRELAPLVSHVLAVGDAQAAYDLYARPQKGRHKVVLEADPPG